MSDQDRPTADVNTLIEQVYRNGVAIVAEVERLRAERDRYEFLADRIRDLLARQGELERRCDWLAEESARLIQASDTERDRAFEGVRDLLDELADEGVDTVNHPARGLLDTSDDQEGTTL